MPFSGSWSRWVRVRGKLERWGWWAAGAGGWGCCAARSAVAAATQPALWPWSCPGLQTAHWPA